jgi:hypothetical protein
MPDDHEERLTILERAQLLYDATLRRHGDIVDRHEERMARLEGLLEQQLRTQTALQEMAERLTQRQDQHADWLRQQHELHEERMAKLQQTLDAIKDMLERGNGH